DARREGVDDRDAHAVQPAGDRIAGAAELSARVQDRHHDLDGRPTLGGVDRYGDAATVVHDPHATVGEQGDLDVVAVSGERLVHRVVHSLVHQVVETALTGRADVHAGALADCLEPLENRD